MKITPVKAGIVSPFADITEVLSGALSAVPENSILAITSKIVSLCEGNIIRQEDCEKSELIKREADLYLPKGGNPYDVYLTIKNNVLIPNAGIDESNSDGYYVLWPKDPQASAQRCWQFIREQCQLKNIGVMITDSTDTPLKWGVTGICIAHCGFAAVNNHIGTKDLFGKPLRMTKVNAADGLAAAAVLCMGETNEQTPLALLEDLPFVRFQQGPPTQEELQAAHIALNEDIFGQLLTAAHWHSKK